MSEIKQINTGVADIIAVKVPEGSTDHYINNVGCLRYSTMNGKLSKCLEPVEMGIYLVKTEWRVLGIDTELTEEQCRDLVEPELSIPLWLANTDKPKVDRSTAKEAFASLMQANGINEPHLILKRLS